MEINEIKITIHRNVNFCPYEKKINLMFDQTINKKKYKVLIQKGEIKNYNYEIEVYDKDISLHSICTIF